MSRMLSLQAVALVAAVCFAGLTSTLCAAQSTPEPNLRELTQCSSTSDCASSTCCITSFCINKQYAPSSEQCSGFPCGLITLSPDDTRYECQCSSSGTCQTVAIGGTPAPGSPNAPPAVTTSSPIPNPFEILLCSRDSDCGSASCCAATTCVNKGFAPDCSDATSNICPTFSVTCGCDDSRCVLRNSGTNSPNSPATSRAPGMPVTPNPNAPTFPEQAMTCSANGDCATVSCCVSTACINKAFAPDCTQVHASTCPNLQTPCVCNSGRCAVGRSDNQVIIGDSDQNSAAADALSWLSFALVTAVSLMVACAVAFQ